MNFYCYFAFKFIFLERDIEIFFKELSVGTAGLKSVGQTRRLKSQAGVDAAVLSQNFLSWKLQFCSYVLQLIG